ncbi:hypothetical protein ACP4J4_10515 [Aureimonas ureilytica]|uniref:hypothetical protein n=1 Tax=Aureimonas ureilytica TaxID=401562 RepID=UPI003CE6C1CB
MSEPTRFAAYITKYALTDGIKRTIVEDCFSTSPTMVKELGTAYPIVFHGKDWHRTEAEALARAEEMRQAKIASLRKSIAKLEKLSFTPSPRPQHGGGAE